MALRTLSFMAYVHIVSAETIRGGEEKKESTINGESIDIDQSSEDVSLVSVDNGKSQTIRVCAVKQK